MTALTPVSLRSVAVIGARCDDIAAGAGLRVRGVQCRARYAEAFTVEKSVLESGSDCSVN